MSLNKQEVVDQIRKAFHGVTLGGGVGLWEGQAREYGADYALRTAERERDEKHNWERIPVELLNECHSSLSFFDAEGMRFHLPAFMIAQLDGRLDMDCDFHLTRLDNHQRRKLAALSKEQREAVREFLRFLRDTYDLGRPEIDQALADHWSSPQALEGG